MDLNNLPLNFPQDSNPNDKIGVGVDHPHLHADLLKDAMQEEIINNNNKIVLQDFSGLLSTNHSIFSSATPMNLLSFTTATNGGVFPDQLLGQTHFTVKNETSTGPSDLASSVQMDSNGDALENMPVIKDERDNCAAALTCSLSGVPPQTASTINSAKVTTPTSKPAKCPERREKVFTCQTCNKSFGYKHVLQHHERIHTGEKPFECPHCEKRFKRDHHLKTHLRLHTAEKPYHCDQCDRYFVQMGNLRRHLRVHTGERPYPCELCPSRFSDSNQLKHHVLIHKGEKPFECPNCLGRFRRRHRLLHHKCPGTVESSNAFLCKPVIADEDPSAGTKNRSAKTNGRKTYKRKCRVTKKVSKSLKSSSSSRKTAKIIPDKSNSNDSTEEDNLSDNSSHSEPTVDED